MNKGIVFLLGLPLALSLVGGRRAAAQTPAAQAPAAQTPAAPATAEAVAAKARALDGRGRPDLAMQAWRQVLLVDPNHQEALASLARFAKQSGKTDESNAYLARLQKLNPNHPALTQVQSMRVLTQQQARLREAERLAGLQQFDRALQVYREVYGDDPPEGGQAIAFYETQAAVPGGWESATNALKALSDKYPQSEEYKLSLGRLLTYRPNTRLNGLRLLESIRNNSDLTNKARMAWRQALVWEGGNPQVAASLRAYVARYPDPELMKITPATPGSPSAPAAPQRTGLARTPTENAGFVALSANRLPEAEAQFEKALKENPGSPGALAGFGYIRMKQEDFAAAIEYFEKAGKEEPVVEESLEASRYFLAMKQATTAFKANDLDQAAASYQKALELRNNAPEALQGLAGALAKAGKWPDAMPVYERLTQTQPQQESAWMGWLIARYRTAGGDSLLSAVRQLPENTRLTLARSSVEYLAMVASATSDTGRAAEAKGYLQQAVDLANAKATPLSPETEMQFAGLFLRLGYPNEAATVFERATLTRPEAVEGWEGLAAALVQSHQEARAFRLLEKMPRGVSRQAMNRAPFLRSLAAIQISMGGLDLARDFLKRSIEVDGSRFTAENVSAQLQLADLLVRQGDKAQAEASLRQMARTYPENPEVWKGLVSVLHLSGQDEQALDESRRVPAGVALALQEDADYVILLASLQDVLQQSDAALTLARRAADLLTRARRPLPADLKIQLAWLILKTDGDERELYTTLQALSAQSDLSADQSQNVSRLWSSWSLKRSNVALAAGDFARATAILQAAIKIVPKDPALRSTLAGVYLKANQPANALKTYRDWGLVGGAATDYAGAIGAAVAAGEKTYAADWLAKGLNQWPADPTILKLAGQQAAAAGDLRKAERYWRAALLSIPESAVLEPQQAVRTISPAQVDPKKAIGDLLLGNEAARGGSPTGPTVLPSISAPAPADRSQPNKDRLVLPTPPGQRNPLQPMADTLPGAVRRANLLLVAQETQVPLPQAPRPTLAPERATPPVVAMAAPPAPVAGGPLMPDFNEPIAPTPNLRDELQDRIEAIAARNTPYMGFGGGVRARSGDAGFERLIVQEANLEASLVAHNTLRILAIGRPTYLDGGTPDGQSLKRFGLLPTGSAFDSQSVGGVGGELQLSTQTFGLRAGATPQNFLAPNFVGGIRFRPGNGPITLLAEREVVRDSLLSYAGVRDPISNRVWGGVVSTGASAQGRFGGEQSGFYGSVGFQRLTGKEVLDNQRLDGNIGAYWKLFGNQDGSLTGGFNLFAMHYEKNLRFYTLGHGGYFSPQRYLLMSFPLEWRGLYRRKVQYAVHGSLGSQHFEEESSPYFPTLSALQGKNGPVYPRRSATGANYDMDARVAYQVTPNWHLGVYSNFNNSRDYSSQAVGIYLRFSTRPRSVMQEFGLPSVPDWKGLRPFGL